MEVINEIESEKWSDFVDNHSNGNFFQSPEAYSFFGSVNNYESVKLFCLDAVGEILGVLVAVIQKEGGIKGYFSRRCILWGGPLVSDGVNNIQSDEIIGSLLKVLAKQVKKKAIYIEIRNLFDTSQKMKSFIASDFHFDEHLNVLIDLSKTEDELWKNIHSKRKNEIRKAMKQNVSVSDYTSADTLNKCYEILKGVYKRAKLPFPRKEYFSNLYNLLYPIGKFKTFCAYYNGEMIGCMLVILYKKQIYDFYAGSYSQYYNKYPNDIIPWEVIRWGRQNGFLLFDFGGAGKPNIKYGVREYKLKFGGELVNFGRYKVINNTILYDIGEMGLKLLRKFK